ncbi:MAG: hydroxyisourate hydrolase [Polyangiales bacterium]
MRNISTHVLDTSRGTPAAGVSLLLEQRSGTIAWRVVGQGITDAQGRCAPLIAADAALESSIYRLTFQVESYFAACGTTAFYPEISIVFTVPDPTQHYHVPLLLSPFGYATYRGS